MGRKPILVLDTRTRRELKKLAEYQLTTKEAAAVLGVSNPALSQWFNKCPEAKQLSRRDELSGPPPGLRLL
jgi:predicted transcriptional regulator